MLVKRTLFATWCDEQDSVINGHHLHLVTEKPNVRSTLLSRLRTATAAHYDDPRRFAARTRRLGYRKAAKLLRQLQPTRAGARSGDVGEILATELVPALLPDFRIPIKRLRWKDGRNMAMRGEDLIGIAEHASPPRFLKGECKSGQNIGAGVVAEARRALKAYVGRPSQHAMAFVMNRLFELNDDATAKIFEEYLLNRQLKRTQLIHFTFALSGNNSAAALNDDLDAYTGRIEQHAVAMRIKDHKKFIASLFV